MSRRRYVIKRGKYYANGVRGWTDNRTQAFVFRSGIAGCNARQWAKNHAEDLGGVVAGEKLRVVRLLSPSETRIKRAIAVADACLAWVSDIGECHTCGYDGVRAMAHDDTCPIGLYGKVAKR